MSSHRTALVWFRRDLRLTDQPALHAALGNADRVVPVYIHAPDEDAPWQPGAASRWWLHHSLIALSSALERRSSRLIVRSGPSLQTLQALIRESGATMVAWCRLYEPAARERDAKLAVALAEAGIEVRECVGSVTFEPGSLLNAQQLPYRVFTPFWRAAQAALDGMSPPSRAPSKLPPVASNLHSTDMESLDLLPRVAWDAGLKQTWTPGEAGAHRRLKAFVDEIAHYRVGRDRPDRPGTSRLSPHLHFGEIGPRQILTELHAHGRQSQSIATFRKELGWREFAHHLLYHFPETHDRPLDRRYEALRWSRNQAALRAWQRGATGFPIVDAGMRELWHTGWMHNRIRMIAASLLTKNLRIDWRSGARWFWDTLVDADLANNTLGWQWTAGCGADAAPYYRIFNPVLQAERFDPHRAYVRRWVPELARLPDRWIHRPWEAPEDVLDAANVQLGKTYPRPIVDLKRSREAALEAYEQVKRAGRGC
jgi:deoxyribodipyrimidine photo-lyase